MLTGGARAGFLAAAVALRRAGPRIKRSLVVYRLLVSLDELHSHALIRSIHAEVAPVVRLRQREVAKRVAEAARLKTGAGRPNNNVRRARAVSEAFVAVDLARALEGVLVAAEEQVHLVLVDQLFKRL